jgi:hypothetical protein
MGGSADLDGSVNVIHGLPIVVVPRLNENDPVTATADLSAGDRVSDDSVFLFRGRGEGHVFLL